MKEQQAGIALVLLALFFQSFTVVNKLSPNEIVGIYWSPKKDAKIEIYLKGQEYFGKFTWLAIPKKDIKNPAKELRSRDVLGLELLTHFSYKDGVYTGGEIYDP